MDVRDQVEKLIYAYVDRVDAGDLTGAAAPLRGARIILDGQGTSIPGERFGELIEGSVILYEDGTPRTRHLISNLRVEAEGPDQVVAHSTYTVMQQVGDTPLQAILVGRYVDRFRRVAGEEGGEDVWVWAERNYSLVDLVGDLTRHLRPGYLPSR